MYDGADLESRRDWTVLHVRRTRPFRRRRPGGPSLASARRSRVDVVITYSYSNLLDGSFPSIDPGRLRSATEEALRLWASYAPLHFIESPDSGPPPSEFAYFAGDTPQIRIGHHPDADLAHAFSPGSGDGRWGDIHFDSGRVWTLGGIGMDFLQVMTHELGHALGLAHELDRMAIMNPDHVPHFNGPGSAFLFPADIEQLRDLYGSGIGSVTPADPVPEPATLILVGLGLGALARRYRAGSSGSQH